ncbi:MAG TPA: hypothetical protein PL009_11510 [Flavipsychrobacter sp.]|nr:hypothetical protein [Flavipsychrobacter sp.]
MVRIYIEKNYPASLADALKLIESLRDSQEIEVIHTLTFPDISSNHDVVFMFDHQATDIDKVTEYHYRNGFRVFAFKFRPTKNRAFNRYDFAWTVINLWPKFLGTIEKIDQPFVFTYNYGSKNLKQLR